MSRKGDLTTSVVDGLTLDDGMLFHDQRGRVRDLRPAPVPIADTHGHLTGDYWLREMSRCLLGRIRREELFARYGGEEFAAVLPETDLEGARHFGETIRALVADTPFEFEGDTFPVTISVGIHTLDGQEVYPPEFIKRADENLYRAKREGRNRVIG